VKFKTFKILKIISKKLPAGKWFILKHIKLEGRITQPLPPNGEEVGRRLN
jgi:hypothetical protein